LAEWTYVETEPSEHFCHIHYFGLTKRQDGVDIDFVIAVKEYVNPPDPAMKFLAQADKQTNQKTAPYTPMGWGPTLAMALYECVKAIRRFPYEPSA
jgi:hypothetical protein